jgi:hypothetical protein
MQGAKLSKILNDKYMKLSIVAKREEFVYTINRKQLTSNYFGTLKRNKIN